MRASETIVELIGIMDEVNDLASRIIVKPGARYLSITYRRASELYHKLKETLGSKPEFLPTLLQIEVGKKHFDSLIAPLEGRISSFTNWYHPQSEVIDESFSLNAIEKAIDSEVDFKYGKECKEAQDDFITIDEDEKVWHQLVRAYGSRSNSGTMPDSQLTQDDWDYIRGSLEEFMEHFNRSEVDLQTVYREFETKIKPEWRRCYRQRDEVYDKMKQYRRELERVYERDAFVKIDRCLRPLMESISSEGLGEECKNNQVEDNSTAASIHRLREFETLRDCIPSEDVYNDVIQLADEYFKQNSKIDGVFGYTILQQLKQHQYLHEGGCSQAHFGELLLKQFGNKCSFKKGDAISDAKDSVDVSFVKRVQELFDKRRIDK